MSDLDEMRRLLAHIKTRQKLSNQAKVNVYKKHVLDLIAESSSSVRTPRTELFALPKQLQGLIGELVQHRLPVVHGMVELAYKGAFGRTSSAFDNWFQAQFGPPPFPDALKLEAAREEVRTLEYELEEKKRRLARHEQYMEHERAALYAWQARGGSPKPLAKARTRGRK